MFCNFDFLRKKYIFIYLIFFLLSSIYAYDDCNLCFDTPWTWPITSDYGPRNVGTWFHEGIDYGMPMNEGIHPIETGNINFIGYLEGAGWVVRYSPETIDREWQVFHVFTGTSKTLPVLSCPTLPCTTANRTWELKWATLVSKSDENDIINSYIIIQWDGNYARRVFTIQKDAYRYIRNLDGTYIMSSATERAETRSDVEVGVPFAPSGNSGGYPYHLHLGVNRGTDNPLRYLRHTPDNPPAVNINNPPAMHMFTKEELIVPYPITITVNSTGGFDLDKVDVWVYKGGSENPADRIHLPYPLLSPTPVTIQNTFQYGGVVGEDKSSNVEPAAKGRSGVIPINETPGTDKFILYQTFKDLKLASGVHKIVVRAEDVNGNSTYAQSSFVIVPEGAAIYHSGISVTPGPTGTPAAGGQYVNVVVKDLKQEATEEPVEITGTITPSGSEVPTPTPEAEIKVVPIDKYLKGVMLSLVGQASYGDSKYKEGFKAMGIAAYTLLLYEIQKNQGGDYDIAVNGYTGAQNYYIPYVDFDTAQAGSGVKNLINEAVRDITVTVKDEMTGDIRYYIQAFWFDAIKEHREDFERDVDIGGQSVRWPYIKTLMFSYAQIDENKNGSIDEAERTNVIIQSSLNVIGKAETYLRETMCDEEGVGIPGGLKSGTKCGMSAWGALNMSKNNFRADMILKRFYHWAPVMLNKLEITQDNVSKYYMERGRVKYKEGKIIREVKPRKEEENKGADSQKPAQVKMYWTDKIEMTSVKLKRKDSNAISVPVVAEKPEADEGYLSVVKGEITTAQFNTLFGNKRDTISVIFAVEARDIYTGKKNDFNPESVPELAMKGEEGDSEETQYESSILGSDETNVFSVIYSRDANEETQGDDYVNVDKDKAKAGSDVKLSLDGKLSVDMNIQLPKQDISILIPRPDLSGVKWGFDGSKFAIALFPDAGQYLSGCFDLSFPGIQIIEN